MKMRAIFAALVLAMLAPLAAGCAALGVAGAIAGAATSSQPLGDTTRFDEQGMYIVEALYNVPAQAYVSADTRNVPGWASVKPVVRPLLIEAYDVLKTVREAYRLGDERSFHDRVTRLRSLKERIMSHIPAG